MLYDQRGGRKYLTSAEYRAFVNAAKTARPDVETFCLALAYTGARILELLNLTPRCIDFSAQSITLESLKKRRKGVFRTVPVPTELLNRIDEVHQVRARQSGGVEIDKRIWPFCRTSGWYYVKAVLRIASVTGPCAMPKGLRHALAVRGAADAGIPLNIIQRWLGHSRIETTALYANAIGEEERRMATRMWDTGEIKS
jgi:integrase